MVNGSRVSPTHENENIYLDITVPSMDNRTAGTKKGKREIRLYFIILENGCGNSTDEKKIKAKSFSWLEGKERMFSSTEKENPTNIFHFLKSPPSSLPFFLSFFFFPTFLLYRVGSQISLSFCNSFCKAW